MCKRADAVEARFIAADLLMRAVLKMSSPVRFLTMPEIIIEPSGDALHLAYDGTARIPMPDDFFDKLRKIA